MFEFGWDQAAGLRAEPAGSGPTLMPVASTAQPARAYELLCTVATHLDALGRHPVIVDGSATEAVEHRSNDGSHLGLLHALQDPSISGLARPADGSDWLVMPGSLGLQALQQTARVAGASAALSRLLAPFAAGTTVLLYAPAMHLASLLAGLQARVLVPVLPQAQGSFDAYGSTKLLHRAGLSPVLAPLDADPALRQAPLDQVVRSVAECAHRHLDYAIEIWPLDSWGLRVQESALLQPTHLNPHDGQRARRPADSGMRLSAAHPQRS